MQLRRVIILGSHPAHGYSMSRYTDLLAQGYRDAGFDVRVERPPSALSMRTSSRSVRKLFAYLEQLVVFPLTALVRLRADVWHIADHSDAIWLLLVPSRGAIVTCHDLIAVRAALGELPEHLPRWSGRLYQSMVRRGLRRASQIQAVSDSTRSDVERIVRDVPTTTVHNPLAPRFADAAASIESSRLAAPPFVLIVSSSGWRKRRGHALAVWQRLRSDPHMSSLRVIVVGAPLIPSELESVPPADRHLVEVETHITDSALAGLYSAALAVIQVSLYEGFGWPIVEGNSLGTPAICSDLPVFREVGDGAIFIHDDLENNDWRGIVSSLMSDTSRRAAKDNALRFSMVHFSERLSEEWPH